MRVVVDIGGGTRGSNDELDRVRGAVILSDGRIVVANEEQELRYYTPSGDFLFRAGRAGEGPGEFRFLYWVGQHGDTVLTFDLDLRRVSAFDANGSIVTSTILPPTLRGSFPLPVGVMSDGSLLVLGNATPRPGRGGGGLSRDSSRLYAMSVMDGEVIEVGTFPIWDVLSGGGVAVVAPLRPEGHFAPSPEGFLFAFSDTGIAYRFDREGAVLGTVSFSASPMALDESDWEREREGRTRRSSRDFRLRVGQVLEQYDWPGRTPAFGELLSDRSGRLWVREPSPVSELPSPCWTVVDARGVAQSSVFFPERFEPFAVGDTSVGLVRGEDAVQHVLVVVRPTTH